MDKAERGSVKTCPPDGSVNHASLGPVLSESPTQQKKPVAGSGRPRPPLPKKPLVAQKPMHIIKAGGRSDSESPKKGPAISPKPATPPTLPRIPPKGLGKSLGTHTPGAHSPTSSPTARKKLVASQDVNSSPAKSGSSTSLNSNKISNNKTADLGLYAAGKSFFYVDPEEDFSQQDIPSSSTSSSASSLPSTSSTAKSHLSYDTKHATQLESVSDNNSPGNNFNLKSNGGTGTSPVSSRGVKRTESQTKWYSDNPDKGFNSARMTPDGQLASSDCCKSLVNNSSVKADPCIASSFTCDSPSDVCVEISEKDVGFKTGDLTPPKVTPPIPAKRSSPRRPVPKRRTSLLNRQLSEKETDLDESLAAMKSDTTVSPSVGEDVTSLNAKYISENHKSSKVPKDFVDALGKNSQGDNSSKSVFNQVTSENVDTVLELGSSGQVKNVLSVESSVTSGDSDNSKILSDSKESNSQDTECRSVSEANDEIPVTEASILCTMTKSCESNVQSPLVIQKEEGDGKMSDETEFAQMSCDPTCDMLKEIEDFLNKNLGDIGKLADKSLEEYACDCTPEPAGLKPTLSASAECLDKGPLPESRSFPWSSTPFRPPRPKRAASRHLKQFSVDSPDAQLSGSSRNCSADESTSSFKKPCPPKPKRTSLPGVGRSQSDVSGMKHYVDQVEAQQEKNEKNKPPVPPRQQSFSPGDNRPPPLPPRNRQRSVSIDESKLNEKPQERWSSSDPDLSLGQNTDKNSPQPLSGTSGTKVAPFAKPPRHIRPCPSRKAPPPPPHPPLRRMSADEKMVMASGTSVSSVDAGHGNVTPKGAQYRKIETQDDHLIQKDVGDVEASSDKEDSIDHDYHEIPENLVSEKEETKVISPVKEITPPPDLPPRSYIAASPVQSPKLSQRKSECQSDSSGLSDAVSSCIRGENTEKENDVSSSESGQSLNVSVSKSEGSQSDKPGYHDMSVRTSPRSLDGRPVSSVSQQSTTSESGSLENDIHHGLHELSSGSDSEQEDEETKKRKKAKKVFYIAEEIVKSEKVFVDVLKLLNVDFRLAVSKAAEINDKQVIPSETLNKVLDYLPQLQNFNEDLLKDLTERMEKWDICQQVSDIFVKKGPFLKLYSSYIRNFENSTAMFDDACKKYPAFQTVVKEFEASPRCACLALKHYMLKPIQRIPQYKLLLQDYLRHLSPDSPDYKNTITALNIVSEVADHANESMRHGDNVQKLMEIQHSLIGQFEVIQPGRTLLKSGELQKLSRKEMQPRMFFLFNDVLLYTTPVASGYRLNNILPLTGMKVHKSTSEEFGNEFSIMSVQRSFAVAASTSEEKDDWLKVLTEAIEESTQRRHTFEAMRAGPQTSLLDKDFVLGHKAPLWVPDARVTMCMLCLGEFTITWRRHHCRSCGRVVCGNCSDNRAPLRYLKYKPARVCDDCFEKLKKELLGEDKTDATVEDSHDGQESALSFSSLKERFQKIRKSARKKYSFQRPAVLKEVHANDEGSSMSGYLRQFRNKKWKRLWFVMKEKVLYTYKASEDMAAIESRPLLGFEVQRLTRWFEGAEPDLLFQLIHPNMEALVFRTDSAAATTKWVTVMIEASVA